ncbi:MAG TPA: hypothetical protein VEG68_15750 [Terriglobales bacterium]|nr:hypothetical protein [Terriglobales bacterium]
MANVSLKPVETAIKKTQSQLRTYSRTAPLVQKAAINRKLKRLDLLIKRVREECCQGKFNMLLSLPKAPRR